MPEQQAAVDQWMLVCFLQYLGIYLFLCKSSFFAELQKS